MKKINQWPFKSNGVLKVALVSSALALGSTAFNAQVNSYQFAQTMGSFTPITGGTVLGTATANTISGSLDTAEFTANLPFNFVFNGESFNEFKVSSNGYITFGGTAASTGSANPISSTSNWKGAVAAFARDINGVYDISGKTSDIRVEVLGAAPNREAVVQWSNFRPAYSTSTTAVYTFNFQIRLKESNGAIQVVYDKGGFDVGTLTTANSVYVGLRGATNTDFNNRLNTTSVSFNNSSQGTANSSAQNYSLVATSAQGMPDTGLTYTWTPASCFAPNSTVVNNITTNSAVVSWLAPVVVPAGGYDLYYDATGTVPSATTAPSVSGVTGTSTTLSNLAPSTTYTLWIRSKCSASDLSAWVSAGTFTTDCVAVTSFYEDFETTTVGNYVPTCWNRLVPSASAGSQTISTTSPVGARNLYMYASSSSTPVTVVLPTVSNINAGTHWLRFRARVSSVANSNLQVGYLTDGADASTFQLIQGVAINTTSYTTPAADEYTVVVPNTVPANARLAIKATNDGKSYYIDEVRWELAPSCLAPSGVTVTNITSSSAQVQWVASNTVPANGYDVYYSTTNTAPTATTVPQVAGVQGTSTVISNLQPAQQYYVWVRSACSASELSDWTLVATDFSTLCQSPTLSAVTGATVCVNGIATLSASVDPATATINWYDSATATTPIATGSSFNTSPLTATTTYYVSANNGVSYNVGPLNPNALTSGSATTASTTYYVEFVVDQPVVIKTVDVFPAAAGINGVLTFYQGTTTTAMNTINFTTTVASDGTTPEVVPVNLALNPGTYRVKLSGGSFYRNYQSNAVFPYGVPGVFSITGGSNTASNSYYFVYNFKVDTGCESARQPVVATVDTNCLGTNELAVKDAIKVYPNPFVDVITISNVDSVKSAVVVDAAGRVVKTFDKVSSQISLGDLKGGMYILNLNKKDGSKESVKIIKK